MINGKKIVLTGANSGIGLEVLKLLAEGDNKILAVDLHTDNIEKFDPKKLCLWFATCRPPPVWIPYSKSRSPASAE